MKGTYKIVYLETSIILFCDRDLKAARVCDPDGFHHGVVSSQNKQSGSVSPLCVFIHLQQNSDNENICSINRCAQSGQLNT